MESIKEEPRGSETLQVNSFTEVTEMIRVELDETSTSSPTRVAPHHDLETYRTIHMPVL